MRHKKTMIVSTVLLMAVFSAACVFSFGCTYKTDEIPKFGTSQEQENDSEASEDHTHEYGEPVWAWADDYSSATVSVTCEDADCNDADGNRTLTETAVVTSSTTATCTESGTTTYTATATINGEEMSDVKTAETPAEGHIYAEPGAEDAEGYISWTWGKGSSGVGVATLTLTCTVCGETWVSDATAGTATENTDEYTATVTGPNGEEYADTYTLTGDEELTHVHSYEAGVWTWSEDYTECTRTLTCEVSDGTTCGEKTRTETADVTKEKTGATCTVDAYTVYTATYKGGIVGTATVTDEDTATGHTAKTYDDDKSYAVYNKTNAEWTTECDTCGAWYAVNGLSGYVLVATDNTSFTTAIGVAKEAGYGADNTDVTEILIPENTSVKLETYVNIDFNNVTIYGADRETSKIVDAADTETGGANITNSGIQISGSNITIKNLTIDGSVYTQDTDESSADRHVYLHVIRVTDGDNINIVSCTITGGGHKNSDSSILIQKGTDITIENCDISEGCKGIYFEVNGTTADVAVKNCKIDAEYPIEIQVEPGNSSTVNLRVYDSELYGRNSLGTGTSLVYFEGCTFGYHLVDYTNGTDGSDYVGTYFGVFNAYADATLVKCYFMAIPSDAVAPEGKTVTNERDPLVNESRNYAVNGRTAGIVITLIGCTFENTNPDLDGTTVEVTSDTFMYIVGSKSAAAIFVFEDGGDQWQFNTTSLIIEKIESTNGAAVTLIGKKEDSE